MQTVNMTESQSKAYHGVISASEQGRRISVIKGLAGTGKTTLARELTRHFAVSGSNVLVVSPTHKAINVFRSGIPPLDNVQYNTLHAALGFIHDYDLWTGEEIFYQSNRKDTIGLAQVVIFDEASMISSDFLDNCLLANQTATMIFVGDDFQLPPIGERSSRVFSDNFLRSNRAASFSLTEIMRQEDADIVDTAAAVRFQRKLSIPSESDAVKTVDNFDPSSHLDDFSNGDAKVLVWTNKKALEYNLYIRRALGVSGGLKKGERLIACEPLGHYKNPVVATNEEVWVVEVAPFEFSGLAFNRVELVSERDKQAKADVIAPESAAEYEKRLNEMKKTALSFRKGSSEARASWAAYYGLKNRSVDLRLGYASTVHRSQGSTINTVFIDLPDMSKSRDKYRMLYTAITRAKRECYFIGTQKQ